jgi:hypothetical protein
MTKFAVRWRTVSRALPLVFAAAFIAIATLTPAAAEGTAATPFWCLGCTAFAGADIATNVVLFIPLGAALVLLGVTPTRAALLAFAMSALIEAAQHSDLVAGRTASITDILTNGAGAWLGALAAARRAYWSKPSRAHAALLATGAALFAGLVIIVSSWALGRDGRVASAPAPFAASGPTRNAEHGLQKSALVATPGYGWFHGNVRDVVMNGATFAHSGDGPVLLAGEPSAQTDIVAHVSGRDERLGIVPFVYAHANGDTLADVLLAERGNDAVLEAALRGRRFRLSAPQLVLTGGFAVPSLSATADAQPTVKGSPASMQLEFRARVTKQQWSLATTRGGETRTVILPITASLGWTLFQNVVHVDQRAGRAATLLWLAVLSLPVGYWCAWCRAAPATVAMGVLVFSLALLPVLGGIAATRAGGWISAVVGFAGAFAFGRMFNAKHPAVA